MKKTFLPALVFITGAMAPSYAVAQDNLPFPGAISGNIALTSEYTFRGIAQSNENPAIQGGVDYSHDSGFYLGAWGSNVNFNDGDEAQVEVDVYGGFSGELQALSWDLGLIYYAYPGADSALDYDFIEVAGSLGHDFGPFAVSGSLNYSPEYFGDSDEAYYIAGDVEVPLPSDLSLSAHIGYQSIDDEAAFGVPDYTDWSVGLGYNLFGFDLGLQYIDTDLDRVDCADGCDERVVFSVGRTFE